MKGRSHRPFSTILSIILLVLSTSVIYFDGTMEILSAYAVLRKGLSLVGIRVDGRSKDLTVKEFGKHYGSSPTVISEMWYDLQTTAILKVQLSTNVHDDGTLLPVFMMMGDGTLLPVDVREKFAFTRISLQHLRAILSRQTALEVD
jgi:hypothetical protein